MRWWIFQVLIALDQLFNALLRGWADETLSARAWRAYRDNKIFGKIFKPVIDTLLWFDKNHCFGAYKSEQLRQQLPPEFRNG